MRGSDFVLDCFCLLYYICLKINFKNKLNKKRPAKNNKN